MVLRFSDDGFTPWKFEMLKRLIYSKYGLLQRMFGLEELRVYREDGFLCFPWFPSLHPAYSSFVSLLCRYVLRSRVVCGLEREIYNEKYQASRFLIDLGMGWEERHVLLSGLKGDYAYVTVKKKMAEGWVPYYVRYREKKKDIR